MVFVRALPRGGWQSRSAIDFSAPGLISSIVGTAKGAAGIGRPPLWVDLEYCAAGAARAIGTGSAKLSGSKESPARVSD